MSFADRYLAKQNLLIQSPPMSESTQIIVVIPCYNEPELKQTIQSLYDCQQTQSEVSIVIVVNDAENSSESIITQNQNTIHEIEQLKEEVPSWLKLYSIYANHLPSKWAGAGWARKIGMDWAITHFNRFNQTNGLLVSLDADSLVDTNYLTCISHHFDQNPKNIGATIYFEHPLKEQSSGIALYELYMRYYKNSLDYCGFPNSMYTVGSCFSVKAKAYVDQGGMNRKKAGEDFYFLHKLLPLGNMGYITQTTVKPSARLSNRVPFGTGPILQKYHDGNHDLELTYPLEAFLVLEEFFEIIEILYTSPSSNNIKLTNNKAFNAFLTDIKFLDELNQLKMNCSTFHVFRKRFFHLFNAFKVLKWLNFSTSCGYPKTNLLDEAQKLLERKNIKIDASTIDVSRLLKSYRNLDKNR